MNQNNIVRAYEISTRENVFEFNYDQSSFENILKVFRNHLAKFENNNRELSQYVKICQQYKGSNTKYFRGFRKFQE